MRLTLIKATLLLTLTLLPTAVAVAQSPTPCPSGSKFGCFEAPLPGIKESNIDAFVKSDNPFSKIVATLANFFIGLIVAIGLVVIVVAGYMYMTSGGSGERVGTAKTMIVSALLGITLALASYLILNTISDQFFDEPKLPSPLPTAASSSSGSSSGGGGSGTAGTPNAVGQVASARTGEALAVQCNHISITCAADPNASPELCAAGEQNC